MLTRQDLALQLAGLGVGSAPLLMVHASLRKIGPIEGGAGALLDSLFEAMAPNGTLVMPLGADLSAPFDAQATPADPENGALAELFRRRKGTAVNDHAAARFGANGGDSAWLLDPIALHDYYARGSALERFTMRNGQVLRLGANPDTITLTHYAEYLAEIPDKRRVKRRYVRADNGEQWIESLDDTDGILEGEGGDYFSQIFMDFRDAGHVAVGRVGNCDAETFRAQAFVRYAVEWLERRF